MKSKILVAVLLLALATSLLLPQVAMAQTIVVNLSDPASFQNSNQRKSFYDANGLQWSFYIIGQSAYYKTSPDNGSNWSAATSLGITLNTADNGRHLGVFHDGIYVHIAALITGSVTKYRRGLTNADGTITWSADWQTVSGMGGSLIYVSVDSNGYPWISDSTAQVTKSSTNDGTWSTAAGFPIIKGNYFSAILPLTGGKMVAIGTAAGAGKISACKWSGVGWGTTVYSSSNEVGNGYFSAVAQDDDVHIVFLKAITYDIVYVKYIGSTNSFSSETTLYSGATSTSAPVITRDTTNNDLWVWYENDPVDDHMYMAVYKVAETTWYTEFDLFDEVDDLPANGYYLNSHYTCPRDNVGVFYIAGTAILKFKSISEQFDVDTLTPTAVTETQATLRGEIKSIGWGTPNVRGIYWNTSPTLSGAEHWYETGSFGTGVFSHTIGNLTEGQTIYYIAYATNAETAWGEWVQLVVGGTEGWCAVTLEPDPINDFDATFRGQIAKLAGTYATVMGWQWGHTATATWYWQQEGNFTISTYSHKVTLEADSIYYVRFYAGNSTVVDYGQWIGFITKVPDYISSGTDETYSSLITAPVPTTAPGGWVRTGKTYDGIPIISGIINTFADLSFGRSFFWFIIEVFLICLITILGAALTKNLPLTFVALLVLFLLPFVALEYLDWWMLAPFLFVGAALMFKEGQFSWS